jgi:hypothetical protein
MNPSFRVDAINQGRTDLTAAMAIADQIVDDTKSNTQGKVIEAWLKGLHPQGFLDAADQVPRIDSKKVQAKALERIIKHAERALQLVKQKVNSVAEQLGVDPEANLKKRAAKTAALQETALNAPTAQEAFYHAAHSPNDKEQLLPAVAKKFGLEAIRSGTKEERKRIFTEQLAPLSQRFVEAAFINDAVERNKELDRVAFEYASMGLLNKALKVVKKITDPKILEHTVDPQHSIGRLVSYLDPKRSAEFAAVRCAN